MYSLLKILARKGWCEDPDEVMRREREAKNKRILQSLSDWLDKTTPEEIDKMLEEYNTEYESAAREDMGEH